jgi:hypothetical protein
MKDLDRRAIAHPTDLIEALSIPTVTDADRLKFEQAMAAFLPTATLATHCGASLLAAQKP